jgi:hypothetical protein
VPGSLTEAKQEATAPAQDDREGTPAASPRRNA